VATRETNGVADPAAAQPTQELPADRFWQVDEVRKFTYQDERGRKVFAMAPLAPLRVN